MWNTDCRDFSLLELLVVLVIIGLLASYVGPKYFSQVGKSEAKVALAQIDALQKKRFRITGSTSGAIRAPSKV